jgi:hypothetical protein
MISRIGTIALLALLGTLLVFFFPAACGPFTATNGPATAFRAAAAFLALLISLCSSLLFALLQQRPFWIAADPILSSHNHGGSTPLSLRC